MNNNLVRKCPNCGASIEHNYNHKCPYCRTSLHMTDEKIRELNNCTIKVKNVYIEKNIVRNNFIITITGISVPKVQWYEEGIESIVVSGDDIGKRVGYRFEIPYEMFYKSTPDELIRFIIESLPPVFEESEGYIIDSLLDKYYLRKFFD